MTSLVNITVHPYKRGGGLGPYFLTKMIEEGISKGIQYIWLEVRPPNLFAKRIYKKFGYLLTSN